jgi:hypothetical protein
VRIGNGVYWDGLFAQNPPVRDLPDAEPDEIWIVQINPTRLVPEPEEPRPGDEPTKIANILDRRNELAGNLSLQQGLHYVRKINELVSERRRTEVPIETSPCPGSVTGPVASGKGHPQANPRAAKPTTESKATPSSSTRTMLATGVAAECSFPEPTRGLAHIPYARLAPRTCLGSGDPKLQFPGITDRAYDYPRSVASSANGGGSAGRSENDAVVSPGGSGDRVDVPVSVTGSGGCGGVSSVLVGALYGAVGGGAGSSVSSV